MKNAMNIPISKYSFEVWKVMRQFVRHWPRLIKQERHKCLFQIQYTKAKFNRISHITPWLRNGKTSSSSQHTQHILLKQSIIDTNTAFDEK